MRSRTASQRICRRQSRIEKQAILGKEIESLQRRLFSRIKVIKAMLLRLAEIASRIETAEKTIRSEQKQERIAYFRILVETGIRHTQLMDLREENLKGNQIELLDKKIGGKTVYVDLDGRLPEISDETKNMLVADELGFYFHDTLHRYRRMIYTAMLQGSDIHIHDIRYFALHRKALYFNFENLQRGRYVVRYKKKNPKE